MSTQRRAVTLLELLLVLVLLCVIFALAWPAIEGSFEDSRLRSAADQVRAAWSEAKVDAMQSGMPHLFRYDLNSCGYAVTRWDWNATADRSEVGETPQTTQPEAKDDELPENIVFAAVEIATDQRSSITAATAIEQGVLDASAATPIVFYPDGTTTDAALLLKNKRGLMIRVTLRGLTGVTRVSQTLTAKDLAEEE